MTENFLTGRTIIPWNNLPRDAVESPWLEVLKMNLDGVQDNPIEGPFSTEGWTWLHLDLSRAVLWVCD